MQKLALPPRATDGAVAIEHVKLLQPVKRLPPRGSGRQDARWASLL